MKEKIISILSKLTSLKAQEISEAIEIPKESSLGDYAFPCFTLAKRNKKNPVEIARELASKIPAQEEFEKVEANGPYINFFINRVHLARNLLNKIQKEKEKYGSSAFGKGKTLVIEFSSPNIAKPFGIGHLRSTIIGNSLANIYKKLGFKVVRINYLGDWGTPFGKILLGFKKFGSKKMLKKDPVKHLYELYVKVNENPDYEPEAREWFKKMESGDKEALSLWKQFKSISLKEFNKLYKKLGIKFEVLSGESFYNKKMKLIVSELENKNLLEKSEGAKIVNLEKYNLGVSLIEKSDGATLYITRDLAAAIERHEKYKFKEMLYEVGVEQNLHFAQLFKILSLMGYKWAQTCKHIDHGLYLDTDGKKFATRKGKTIFMEDVLEDTERLAQQELKKRYPSLSDKELKRRAEVISQSAIFYGDLKNFRAHDVVFDIQRFLSFEGDTGPYLLYTYARAKRILSKAKYRIQKNLRILKIGDKEKQLVFQLSKFPEAVKHAYLNSAPNIIANYAYQLSQTFNEFYHSQQVIGSSEEQFRLALVSAFSQVLKNALCLLGISVLETM